MSMAHPYATHSPWPLLAVTGGRTVVNDDDDDDGGGGGGGGGARSPSSCSTSWFRQRSTW